MKSTERFQKVLILIINILKNIFCFLFFVFCFEKIHYLCHENIKDSSVSIKISDFWLIVGLKLINY
jgi:TRAP-type C4-dicarboxylate transport system permease small subunit